jgi:very-short-patch-repair endonuclease
LRQPRNPEMLKRARQLRREMSPPEKAMWAIMRAHRLGGWKFTRQVQVDRYILDFAARRERLAIELDGDSHNGREAYDAQRTQTLEDLGWKVIRFTNGEVMTNPDGVAMAILGVLKQISPSPQPSPRRGEGV